MSRSKLAMFAAGALAAFCAGSAPAALYKWTDAQGRIVYSDQPPMGNVKSEQLRGPPPPANPARQRISRKRKPTSRSASPTAPNCDQG